MAQVTGLPEWMKQAHRPPDGPPPRRGLAGRNLSAAASFAAGALAFGRFSAAPGLLQKIEPKARIYGALALVLAGAVAGQTVVLAGLCVVTAALALLSKVRLVELFKRVLPAIVFTALLVAPVCFGFITPGAELWGFEAPGGARLTVTAQGVRTASFFILRVASMVSAVALLVVTTGQSDFFSAMGRTPVPAFFVTAAFMTFRYLFILFKIVEDASLALGSRTITRTRLVRRQRWFASRAAFLLKKSLSAAEEVSMAMASRGFAGRIRTFEGARMRGKDLLWLGFASFVFFLSLGL